MWVFLLGVGSRLEGIPFGKGEAQVVFYFLRLGRLKRGVETLFEVRHLPFGLLGLDFFLKDC